MGVKEYENNLKGEYLEAYKDIMKELFIEDIVLNIKFTEEIKNDIIDMLLSAQEDGVDVKKVIGEDTRDFSREIIKHYKSSESLSKKVQTAVLFSLTTIYVVLFIEVMEVRSLNIDISFKLLFSLLLIMIPQVAAKILSRYIRITSKRKRDNSIFHIGTLIIAAVFYVKAVKYVDSSPLISCNVILIFFVVALCGFMIIKLFSEKEKGLENS